MLKRSLFAVLITLPQLATASTLEQSMQQAREGMKRSPLTRPGGFIRQYPALQPSAPAGKQTEQLATAVIRLETIIRGAAVKTDLKRTMHAELPDDPSRQTPEHTIHYFSAPGAAYGVYVKVNKGSTNAEVGLVYTAKHPAALAGYAGEMPVADLLTGRKDFGTVKTQDYENGGRELPVGVAVGVAKP